jgi:hypothetical protein
MFHIISGAPFGFRQVFNQSLAPQIIFIITASKMLLG